MPVGWAVTAAELVRCGEWAVLDEGCAETRHKGVATPITRSETKESVTVNSVFFSIIYPPNFSPWARATNLRARRSFRFSHTQQPQAKKKFQNSARVRPRPTKRDRGRGSTLAGKGGSASPKCQSGSDRWEGDSQKVRIPCGQAATPFANALRTTPTIAHQLDQLRRCQSGQTRRGGLAPMPESIRANYRPEGTLLPFAKGEDEGEGLSFCRSSSASQIARNTLSSSWRI